MHSKRTSILALLALTLVFGTTARSSAQMISTTVASTVTTSKASSGTVDLQTDGPTDWVQFGVSGTSTGFSLTNEKSGGSVGGLDTVGAVTQSNDSTGDAGTAEDTQTIQVSYANGTNPAASSTTVSGTAAGDYGIVSGYNGGSTNATEVAGTTLSFTIDFNQAISSGTITLVGNTYGVTSAAFTAALSNGNTTTTDTGTGSTEQDNIFTIDLSNITAGSSLTLSQELKTGGTGVYGGDFDDIAFGGVALDLTAAAIPEPSTWMMAALGGILLLVVCLRRKGRAGPALSRFGSI